MCVLSIKVPIRKKSGNLFNGPRISSLAFLFSNRFVEVLPTSISRMAQRGTIPVFILWWNSCCRAWFREIFSFVCDTLFFSSFFFHFFQSSRFYPNFCNSFSTPSLFRIALKITVKHIFVVFLILFPPQVSLEWSLQSLFVDLKLEQPTFTGFQ